MALLPIQPKKQDNRKKSDGGITGDRNVREGEAGQSLKNIGVRISAITQFLVNISHPPHYSHF